MGIDNDANVIPLRGQPPASAVMPVARKVSGSQVLDVRARVEALTQRLLESALDLYRDAREARAHGEIEAADAFCASADAVMAALNETVEEMATT